MANYVNENGGTTDTKHLMRLKGRRCCIVWCSEGSAVLVVAISCPVGLWVMEQGMDFGVMHMLKEHFE